MTCTKHRDTLLSFLNGLKNIPFNPERYEMIKIVPPTMACDPMDYEIQVEVKTEDMSVVQPVQFYDTTGEYLECWTGGFGKYDKTTGFTNFVEHLHNSQILWIPIDAHNLMEGKLSQFEINCIDAVIKEWKSFNPSDSYLFFLLVKSDQYLDNDNHSGLPLKFGQCYHKILKDGFKDIKCSCFPMKLGFGVYSTEFGEWQQCKQSSLDGFDLLFDSVVACMQNNTDQFIASQQPLFFKSRITQLDNRLNAFYSYISDINLSLQNEL